MSVIGFWAKWVEAAGKLPLRASILAGMALLLAAAVLDWLSGPEFASAIFYLAPISWVTWKVGRWPGMATALASGIIWMILLLNTHVAYPNPVVPLWNTFVRTTSFCLVSGLLSEVVARKRLEGRMRQVGEDMLKQAGILQSILDSMGDGVVVADSHGQLLHMNPAARRTLRIPVEDRDVVAWLESQENYLPGFVDANSSHENPLLRAVRGETLDEVEMLLHRADASEGFWLSITGRPLRDPAGRTAGGVIVFTDISARKKLERQIAEASDREQRRLGEDLHDGLCQHLVSTAFAARRLTAKLGDRSLPEAQDAAEIAELLATSISQARDVSRGLCLVPLEAGGLASALEELATQVRSRHGVACQFVERAAVAELPEAVATNLFRIAQEAVNNAVKHSKAGQITLSLSADAHQVRLQIEDDGIGFEPEAAPARGLGLHMMSYRARTVAAAFNIGPRPGGGTLVSCALRRSNLLQETSHAYVQPA
jgi:signal transduction histidine kinase